MLTGFIEQVRISQKSENTPPKAVQEMSVQAQDHPYHE